MTFTLDDLEAFKHEANLVISGFGTPIGVELSAGQSLSISQAAPPMIDGLVQPHSISALTVAPAGAATLIDGELAKVLVLADGANGQAWGAKGVTATEGQIPGTNTTKLLRNLLDVAPAGVATVLGYVSNGVNAVGCFKDGSNASNQKIANKNSTAYSGDLSATFGGDCAVTFGAICGVGHFPTQAQIVAIKDLIKSGDCVGPTSGLATYLGALSDCWWVACPTSTTILQIGIPVWSSPACGINHMSIAGGAARTAYPA